MTITSRTFWKKPFDVEGALREPFWYNACQTVMAFGFSVTMVKSAAHGPEASRAVGLTLAATIAWIASFGLHWLCYRASRFGVRGQRSRTPAPSLLVSLLLPLATTLTTLWPVLLPGLLFPQLADFRLSGPLAEIAVSLFACGVYYGFHRQTERLFRYPL